MWVHTPYDTMVRGAIEDYRAAPIPMLRCNLRAALESRRYAKQMIRMSFASREERLAFMSSFAFKWNKHFEKYYSWRVMAGQYDDVLGT